MEKLNENLAVPVLVEGILAMREDLDSILETLAVMSNRKLMKSIQRGLRDISHENTISLEELRRTHEKLEQI